MKLAAAALLGAVAVHQASAQSAPPDGFYDPAFGTNGAVTVAFERPVGTALAELGTGLLRTSSGQLLIAGPCTAADTAATCLARLTQDGAVDASFGNGGDGLALLAHPTFFATDLTQHADGTIVVCGHAGGEPATLRVSASGSFLTPTPVTFSFGAPLASADALRCAAVGGGRTYVAAPVTQTVSANDFAVARLDGSGALDAGFSGDGRTIATRTPTQADQEVFGDVTATPDGDVVLVGNVFPAQQPVDSPSTGWEICAFDASGLPRSGFGPSGCKAFQVSANTLEYQAFAVAIDDAQRIVVAGTQTTFGVFHEYAVGRFLLDGQRDTSFNGGEVLGLSPTNPDPVFAPRGIAVDAAGKPVLAGLRELSGGQRQLLTMRVLANGTGLDPGFGNAGESLAAAGAASHRFGGLVLDRDRPVILGSTMSGATPVDFHVVRLQGYPLFADGFED